MENPSPPKPLLDNKRYRAKVLLRCNSGSKAERDKVRSFYYKQCKENILYFFDTFLWTYDPRKDGDSCHIPFILYPFQEEYILWLEDCYKNKLDTVTEKSRDMGVSWMELGWFLYHWIFDESFQALLGSRVEEMVDNGAPDSHYGKLDYMLDRLPAWFVGEEFYGSRKKYRAYMYLENPRTQSVISGQSANRDFSRQGRYSAELLDEFAFWDWGSAVWKATGDSSKCRHLVSTSNGMGNKFYEIVRGIEKEELKIPKKRLHWTLHPLKDRAWYEAERSRRTPLEIAQELDISYDQSIRGRVYDNFTREKNVIENLSYNPDLPVFTSWDFGMGDETAIIWLQKDYANNRVYIIDCYQKAGKEIGFFVPFITGKVESGHHRYTQEELDIIKRHESWGATRIKHFGDPTGGQKSQTSGRSVIEILSDDGIYVNTSYKKFKITARYQDTYRLISRLFVADHCENFIDAILNARWNLPEEDFDPISKNVEPIHDWTSHFRTSLEYFAVNEPHKTSEGKKEEREEERKMIPAKYKRGSFWTRRPRIKF